MFGTAVSITGAYSAANRTATTSHDGVTMTGTPRIRPRTRPLRNDLGGGSFVTSAMLRPLSGKERLPFSE